MQRLCNKRAGEVRSFSVWRLGYADSVRNHNWLLFFAVLPVCLVGCVKRNSPINVGSKFGTEQAVLGEILAQHLEHRLGAPVNRRLGGGDTDSLHQGLVSGEIDLYPEYTGTALRNVLKLNMEHDP